MITAKQLYNTYPHKQMRMYVEATFNRISWPSELSKLTRKFLRNFRDQDGGWDLHDVDAIPRNIDAAFTWGDTPEGHDFWRRIGDYRPAPIVPKVAKPKAAVPAPKKSVGWW